MHYSGRAEHLQQRPRGRQNLQYLLSGHLQKQFAENYYNWLVCQDDIDKEMVIVEAM